MLPRRVSALAPLAGGAIASGCYDGVVRLWEVAEGEEGGGSGGAGPSSSFAAHRGAVKAAVAVRTRGAPGGQLLVTGGADMVGRVWLGVGADGGGSPEAVAELRGHAEGVEAAAASADGRLCCTGGWDSRLLLWQSGAWRARSAEGQAAIPCRGNSGRGLRTVGLALTGPALDGSPSRLLALLCRRCPACGHCGAGRGRGAADRQGSGLRQEAQGALAFSSQVAQQGGRAGWHPAHQECCRGRPVWALPKTACGSCAA